MTLIREFTQWAKSNECLIENEHWVWNYTINISYNYPLAKLHTINNIYIITNISLRKNKGKPKLKNSIIKWDYF